MRITLHRAEEIHLNEFGTMIQASKEEGFRHIQRLYDEYKSGENRFDKSGEELYVAKHDEKIVGVCGLNQDPYYGGEIGRLRRLYILKDYRRHGIGRKLTKLMIEKTRSHFKVLILKTDNPAAFEFYESLGFTKVFNNDKATHRLELKPGMSF